VRAGAYVFGVIGIAFYVVLACASYDDPQGVQLPLFGDRQCSDPVYGQLAVQCCYEHDNCYAYGGDQNAFHACNHEFAACLHVWGVDHEIAEARYNAVRLFGRGSFRWSKHRTRGPPK